MKLARFKPTGDLVMVLISSKTYKGVYEDRTNGNREIDYKTFNYVMDEKGNHKAVTDEDLEILEDIQDD